MEMEFILIPYQLNQPQFYLHKSHHYRNKQRNAISKNIRLLGYGYGYHKRLALLQLTPILAETGNLLKFGRMVFKQKW